MGRSRRDSHRSTAAHERGPFAARTSWRWPAMVLGAMALVVAASTAAYSFAGAGKQVRVHGAPPPAFLDGATVLEGGLAPRVRTAYETAANAWTRFGCRGDWAVLAAIGHVESGHGNSSDELAVVTADGVVLPRVVGPTLDGSGGHSALPDTDGGLLDGDAVWDRAVGPMQFLPATWAESGLDADGDGVADPDDIDDAAMSAAAYLCGRAPGNYGDEAVLAQALLAYNNSVDYARKVLDLVDHYRGRGAGQRVALGDLVPLGVDPRSLVFPIVPAEPVPPSVPVGPVAPPATPATAPGDG